MNKHQLVLSSLVILTACGGSVVASGTGAGSTGTGASTTTSGTGASGTGGSVSSRPCPASQPAGGEACARVPAQFQCTYGDSVRPDCRTAWTCTDGGWETVGGTCVTPTDCPSTEPSAQTVCTTSGDVCTYADSICVCGCGGGACVPPLTWQCSSAPTTPGCPAVVPNDGTPCTAPGVQCSYGDTCTPAGAQAQVSCTSGLWQWSPQGVCF